MAIFTINKYSGGLLDLGEDVALGVVGEEEALANMSASEEIQAQADHEEFAGESAQVEEQVAALESMEEIVTEGEAQVIQNEVNEAAMEGQEVPDDATVVGVVEVEDGGQRPVEEVAAVSDGEVPAPTLTSESAPAEVGVEAIKLSHKLTNFAARLRMGDAESMNNYLGVNKRLGGGCESIMNNPIDAYKEGCLGFKETLVKYKNKVLAFLQKVGQAIVRWFKKFINACKMTKKRAKSLKEKIKGLSASDYKVKENSKLPGAVAWVYGYDSTGKNYISDRAKHVDEIIKKIQDVSNKVLTGKEDPKTVNQKAIKEYGASDGVSASLWKKIKSIGNWVSGTKSISGDEVKIFLPVDNEKAYAYGKFEGNTDDMDSFPRLQTVSVKQEGIESKAMFGSDAKNRIDVAMNLCNSIIAQSDAMSKKMDDAAKAIEKFKKNLSQLVEGGHAEGEGMANKNYAVRRSITVASDMFKVSYVYGVIPSQALTAAYGLIGSIEKKESK